MEKQFQENIELTDVKPFFDNSGLYIPVSVSYDNADKYHGDARSFGLNYESGNVSIVSYEKATGVLADDAVAYSIEIKENKKDLKNLDLQISELDYCEDILTIDLSDAELLDTKQAGSYGILFRLYLFNNKFYLEVDSNIHSVSDDEGTGWRYTRREYNELIKKTNNLTKLMIANIKDIVGVYQE